MLTHAKVVQAFFFTLKTHSSVVFCNVHAPTQSWSCRMQCLCVNFVSNTFCDRTVTFLPILVEVTTAACNLVGEKRMCGKKREEGSAEAGEETTGLAKPPTSATTIASIGSRSATAAPWPHRTNQETGLNSSPSTLHTRHWLLRF